mmetsp:Transcript_10164/g.44206  ORF Transcript_10164/g.44206 Transcript_10164/m.44206 type:complete len:222 (-) Transcript_10164:1115-1780(-)
MRARWRWSTSACARIATPTAGSTSFSGRSLSTPSRKPRCCGRATGTTRRGWSSSSGWCASATRRRARCGASSRSSPREPAARGDPRVGPCGSPPRPSPSQLASRAGREIQTRRGRRRGCRRPGSTSRSTTRRRRGRGRTATGAVTPEVSRGSEAVSCREPPRRRRRGAPLRVRSRRFRRIRARVSLTAWVTFTRARGEVGTRRHARRRTGRDGMRRRLWRW